MSKNLQEVINLLEELTIELRKNKIIKEKTFNIINLLKEKNQIAIEKAILELEEISSLEIDSYYRTQIWDMMSILESINV